MKLEKNKPLKDLTWMKVGGKADYFADIKTKEELQETFLFGQQHDLPVVYLGQGSNLIFPDEGIRGIVIRLQNDSVVIDLNDHSVQITAGGGKILSLLIQECRKKRIFGLDYFVGIPGTVGAAVCGNIGIPAEEFGELVKTATIFDGQQFHIMSHDECRFVYRGSKIREKNRLVWETVLLVKKTPQDTGGPDNHALLQRVAKHPKGTSCGSFFKNPDRENEKFAGKLIEECGLKGKKIGGAYISEKHANFLMNDGSAKSSDIVELARQVKREVLEKKGIVLQNEVLVYNSDGTLCDL